jgi:hypothetical protein
MDFQVLPDAIGNPDRSTGYLLALFLQSDGDQSIAQRHVQLVSSMLEPHRTLAPPKNQFRVLAGARVTLNPALSDEKGFTSLGSFLQSYDTYYRSKDGLASARRAQLFRPFLSDSVNANRRTEFLSKDEHCFVKYKSDEELHLFRCFGGALEPDEVSPMGYVRLDDFASLPPRIVQAPVRASIDASSVTDLEKLHPTAATSLEDIDAWLREYGYDPDALVKSDYARLNDLLKANVTSEIIRVKNRAPKPTKTPSKPYEPGWYETYAQETRSPDVGRVALLQTAAECRKQNVPESKGRVPEAPPAVEESAAAADEGDADGPHNTQELYANLDNYKENAVVTLRRFDGRPTYVLKQGVWRRTFQLPALDKHAAQRVASSVAVRATEDRAKKWRDPSSDAAVFAAWARLRGRLDVYAASESLVTYWSDVVVSTQADDTYDSADNPMFYHAIDPFSAGPSQPKEKNAIDRIVEATHLRLTQKGRTWLSDNAEFYNSEQGYRASHDRETQKLAATLRALEQTAEWSAASDAKQREMRERVRRIGEERVSQASAEFQKKQALVCAALLSLLLAAPAAGGDLLDGAPELHPLCVPPESKKSKKSTVLEQAQAYVVCSLQRARLLDPSSGDVADAVRDYVATILRDKPDMQPSTVAPWIVQSAEPHEKARMLATTSAHVTAADVAPVLEPCADRSPARARDAEDPTLRLTTTRKPVPLLEAPAAHDTKAPRGPSSSLASALAVGDVLQRAKRALLELQVPGAATLEALTERETVLATFVRTELLGTLSRIAQRYKAETTAFQKKFLAPDLQRAVEQALTSDTDVLRLFAAKDSDTFRKHVQSIVNAAVDDSKSSVVALFAAIVLAVCNIPGADVAYPPKTMVAAAPLPESDRDKKAALLTYVMRQLTNFVRYAQSDVEALKTTKVDARVKRDADLIARYESLDPEMKQTIGIFRRMNFRDWKDFVKGQDGDLEEGNAIQKESGNAEEEEGNEDEEEAESGDDEEEADNNDRDGDA